MNCTLLAILFVIIVNSLTSEAEEIFGVEVSRMVGRTLDKDKVNEEMAAKRKVLLEIRNLEKTLPIKGREWLEYFRKLANADQAIVESLATDVSYLNSEQFKNMNNNQELRDHISNSNWKILETGLQNYTKLMQTFKLDDILWNRNFMQNPFEYFFTKMSKENPENLVIKKLKLAFETAYNQVKKAQANIAKVAKALISKLKKQYELSKQVMAELRALDHKAVRCIKKNIEKGTKDSIKKMEELLKSVEGINDITVFLQFFKAKSPWFDKMIALLDQIESAHTKLENEIEIIYP